MSNSGFNDDDKGLRSSGGVPKTGTPTGTKSPGMPMKTAFKAKVPGKTGANRSAGFKRQKLYNSKGI